MDPNNRKLPKSPTSSVAAGAGRPRPQPPSAAATVAAKERALLCDRAQTSPPQPAPATALTPWSWKKKPLVPGKVRLGEWEKGRRGNEKGGGRRTGGGGREEREARAACRGFPQVLQLREAQQCSSRRLERPESAGDSTEPSPVSGRGLFDLLPAAARSPHSPPS